MKQSNQFVHHGRRQMRFHLLTFAIISSLSFSALADKHGGKTAKAATKPAAGAAAVLKVDPAASQIKWEGSKKLVKSAHNGFVKVKAGEVTMNGEQLVGGTFEIDMTSIENEDLKSSPKDQAKLVGHLKSPDFFNTDKFQTATFKITSVKALKPAKAGDPTHEITGDLTLKDKTNPVTFPAVITRDGNMTKAMANITIDRTKWDVRFGSTNFFENLAGDRIINNDISLALNLVAKP